MREVAQNTFDKGLQQDISKLRTPNGFMVDAYQVELTNREGSNFAVCAANGNEYAFAISDGYTPRAIKEYNNVLYIVSTNSQNLELGTYTPSRGYKPLNNLTADGINRQDFRLSFTTLDTSGGQIDYIDLQLQYDYDDTINMIIVSEGFQPLLINTGLSFIGGVEAIPEDRDLYQTDDLLTQVKLITDATDILTVDLEGIISGGRLKPGSYRYYFSYLTEDFNESELAGQSGQCQVFIGENNQTRGGNSTEVTSKQVSLNLTGVDTTFTYLQVYFTYIGGDNVREKQLVKFNQPVLITGSTMSFRHNGLEEVDEIAIDDLGIDFANIASAKTVAAVKGYLFMGNIKENERIDDDLKTFANNIKLGYDLINKPYNPEAPFYRDPVNIYNSVGYFRGESYVFGLVARYKGGGYSSVYPLQGYDYLGSTGGDGDPIIDEFGNQTGIIRMPGLSDTGVHFDANGYSLLAVTFTPNIPVPESLLERVSELFIVRADRSEATDFVAQGIALPTLTMPPTQWTDSDEIYYWNQKGQPNNDANDPLGLDSKYKYLPSLDGLIETYMTRLGSNGPNGTEITTINDDNEVVRGIQLFAINTLAGKSSAQVQMYNRNKLAFYSPDLIANPTTIGAKIDAAKSYEAYRTARCTIEDEQEWVRNTVNFNIENYASGTNANTVGTKYELKAYEGTPRSGTIHKGYYVPENTFATGSPFVSKMWTQFYWGGYDGEVGEVESKGHTGYLPFAGILIDDDLGGTGINDPAGVEARIRDISDGFYNDHNGNRTLSFYPQFGREAVIGHLVNIYSTANGERIAPLSLYTNRDSLRYAQIGQRYTPSSFPTGTTTVFDGDCYIDKIYQRFSMSPYEDPNQFIEQGRNTPQGLIFSYVAESRYNPNLRHVYYENEGDLDDRVFYPYATNYRDQRYADSMIISEGYQGAIGDHYHLPNPLVQPTVKSAFFSRVFPSEIHVPNSFENGWRRFTIGHQDYPTNYGRIQKLVEYGGDLLMIFEHGVGITPVRPRTQTAKDTAGAVFISNDSVITDAFGPLSTKYGSQHPEAVYKSPHFVYGMDAQEGKIWRVGGSTPFNLISDGYIGSKILNMTNPRIGYDPRNKLVYFQATEFCYIYSEELQVFVSRSTTNTEFFTELASQGMYGFQNESAYLFKPTNTLYGDTFEPFIEFAVNPNIERTKVFDYINIVSNNVRPKQIKLTALNYDGTVNQESTIDAGIDFYTQEERIEYRDKRFVAQVPKIETNAYKLLSSWGDDSRLRDKYIIIRLTYDSIYFETMAFLTFFRISHS